MRLKGTLEPVPDGWTGGIVEDAEPGQAYKKAGFTWVASGVKDSCVNFVRAKTGRLAVRGGQQVQLALTNDVNDMTSVLTMQRYSQDGAVLVAHLRTEPEHYAFLYDGTLTTRIAHSPLSWASATPARPRVVELFESVYVADATVNFGSRQPMVALDAAGTVTAVTGDLGSGAEALKPFCHAIYNNVLFIAGQDAGATNAPAMIRHSFLGVSPATVAGWDKDAYNTIGAAGERVTAMVPGNNVLLIAKENELYRLSGFGRALPGWQYVVQPVDNTDYVGVKWPGALCYAENHWYGVGEAGPFRTDGMTVDLLHATRQRSWRQVGALEVAFVRYDPDRRLILFGFAMGENAVNSPAVVQDLWLWHLDDEQWEGDWHLPLFVADVYALAAQGLAGPTKAPLSVAIDDAAATSTEVSGAVNVGDDAASTEVWIAPVDLTTGDVGVYQLNQTLGANSPQAPFTITGWGPTTAISVKARHLKNGETSDFCQAVLAHTRVGSPTITATPVDGTEVDVTVTQQAEGGSLTLQRDGVTIQTWPAPIAAGEARTLQDTGRSGSTTYTYTAWSTEPAWPTAIQTSASVTAQATTGTGPITAPSAPSFLHSAATTSSVTATFTAGSASAATEVWVDKGGGYVLDQTVPAGTTTFTVTGLTHSTTYPVKLRHETNTGDTSDFGPSSTGYTLLQPPTLEQGADPFRGTVHIYTTAVSGEVTLYWSDVGGQVVDRWTSTGGGHASSDSRACGTTQTYKAVVHRETWPTGIKDSTPGAVGLYTGDCL